MVIGVGSTGARATRQLASTPGVTDVVVRDPEPARVVAVVDSMAPKVRSDGAAPSDVMPADVVVLAGPVGTQAPLAKTWLSAGVHVVTTTDDLDEVDELLSLDELARTNGIGLAVGAGFAPGLSDLLAAHAAGRLDRVDEIRVERCGAGGPACARHLLGSLGGQALDWRDGQWTRRPGGSGRELVWFPDPIGARDCFRAEMPDVRLLVRAFGGAQRVTARLAARRRQLVGARLSVPQRLPEDGAPGAIRVEVRGTVAGASETVVFGAMDRPGVAAGAVAALAAVGLASGGARQSGAGGLAELFEPLPMLTELARRGVRCAVFDPTGSAVVQLLAAA